MKRFISLFLAIVMVLTVSVFSASPVYAMSKDYYSSHFKFSTEFTSKFTAFMQQMLGFTMSDWLKDDSTRALLAVCLFGDVLTTEKSWTDYFKLDNIATGGYVAKSGSTEIAFCVWTLDRAMCVTYNPYTGKGTYAMYPFSRDEITDSFGNAPYWTIERESFEVAVRTMGEIMDAYLAGNSSKSNSRY